MWKLRHSSKAQDHCELETYQKYEVLLIIDKFYLPKDSEVSGKLKGVCVLLEIVLGTQVRGT